MKIVINIEKKHFYVLLGFIILVGIGVVIATGWDPTKQSHSTLFTDVITGKSADTVKVQDRFKVIAPGTTDTSFEPGDAMSIAGGNLDLKGNRLIDVNWQGSLPSGTRLYLNTAGCYLGYTSSTNAITTIASCPGSAAYCSGTFTWAGATCRGISANICDELIGCYVNNGYCYGTISTSQTCSGFSQSTCDYFRNQGCTWNPAGQTKYNTPLGSLVRF